MILAAFACKIQGLVKASSEFRQSLKTQGVDYLNSKIDSPEIVAAVSDTLFRMGIPKGGEIIQQAINDTFRQNGSKRREGVDGSFGSGAIGSLNMLADTRANQKQVIDNMMDRRNAHYQANEPHNARGEAARTGSYRMD